MQDDELCTIRCPYSIDKLFKLLFTNISDIAPAETENTNIKDNGETRCAICQKDLWSSRGILWMIKSQNTVTHPVLLVNYLQNYEQK